MNSLDFSSKLDQRIISSSSQTPDGLLKQAAPIVLNKGAEQKFSFSPISNKSKFDNKSFFNEHRINVPTDINETPSSQHELSKSKQRERNQSDYTRFFELYGEDIKELCPDKSSEQFSKIFDKIYNQIPWDRNYRL